MRLTLLMVMMVLLSSVVMAGESFDVDFTEANIHAVYLFEGDEVRFNILGDDHSILLDDINRGGNMIKIGLVPFINDGDSNVFPGIVTMDTISKIDLDKDGQEDVNLALYTISEEGQAHMVLQRVAPENVNPNGITGNIGLVDEVTDDEPKSKKTAILIVIGLALLSLIGFLVFRNKETKQKEEEPKEENPEEEKKESEEEEKDSKDTEENPEEESKQTEEKKPKEENSEEE